MNTIHLRLSVHLENWELSEFSRPHGALFTQWLPDGEKDAIEVKCVHEKNRLRLWFERLGHVDRDFIRYDRKRSEVDETVMQRQAKLDAGDLHGEGLFAMLTSQEFKAIRENAIDHEDYISAGKRVVEFLFTPVSNLIATLKFQYGQYWLASIEPWDSRKHTLGSYCSSNFSLRWRVSEGEEWQRFLPTQQGSTITFEKLPGRGYGEYLSKEDWDNIKNTADLSAGPHLATIILGKANELFDTGYLRQAFVEAGSATEMAINKYVLTRGQAFGIPDTSLKQFFDLPLAKQLAITVVVSKLKSEGVLSEALKAIDIRNKIVHKGVDPSAKNAGCLMALLQVVAALLEQEHKFPVLTSGNKLAAPSN